MVGLAGAVVAHHMPMDHMDMSDMALSGVMVVCMAVLPVVALAAGAAGAAVAGLPPRSLLNLLVSWAPARLLPAPPQPRARSSPVATVVLRR